MLMPKRTALIVPCYNEEQRLKGQAFLQFLAETENIDIWFVNDGSSDGTQRIIDQLSESAPGRIFARGLSENRGKAEAIRAGVGMVLENGNYDYLGYIDADLSAPLGEVLPLNALILEDKHLIVAGSRVKMAGRNIRRTPMRHYISRIFATYYSQLLRVHNYDTQCGLKLFTSGFAGQLFATPFVSRWLFDLELFLRAKKLIGEPEYARKIIEVPLNEWCEVGESRLKWTDFIKAPAEVLKIYSRYLGSNNQVS